MSRDTGRFKKSGYLATPLTTPAVLADVCGDLPPGTVVARGGIPPGLLIVRDFMPLPVRQRLLAYAAAKESVPATVQDVAASLDTPRAHRSNIRVTDHLDIDGVEDWLLPIVQQAFVSQAAVHFGRQVEWFERPALLRYRAGGYYVPHADAENWDENSGRWQRAVDRDVSLLLYLDDDYQGGELDFPNFRFRLKPQAGTLICFPADHRFVHAANEVSAGLRHVVVSWAAWRGSDRVGQDPPARSVSVA